MMARVRGFRQLFYKAVRLSAVASGLILVGAAASPRAGDVPVAVSECRLCHTIKVDDVVTGHYFDDGGSSAMASGLEDDAPGKFKCESCHTEELPGYCSGEHVKCSGGAEGSAKLTTAMLEELTAAVEAGNETQIQRLLRANEHFVLVDAGQAVQVLDCQMDHVIAHLPILDAAMGARLAE